MEPKQRKGRVFLLLAVVLLLLGAAGTAWYLLRDEPVTTNDVTKTEKYQQARKDTDKLRATGKYDEAKQVWQGYIDGNGTEEERYKAYLQLAALDETKGDCKAALVSYYEAEKLTDRTNRAEYEAIARCSEKLNDSRTAATYYQKALDTFPGGPEYDSDRRFYQKKIDAMKQAAGTAE